MFKCTENPGDLPNFGTSRFGMVSELFEDTLGMWGEGGGGCKGGHHMRIQDFGKCGILDDKPCVAGWGFRHSRAPPIR